MTKCRLSTCNNENCGKNDKVEDASEARTTHHKPSVFSPPLSLFQRIKFLRRKCVRAINFVYANWRKLYYSDRFTWQLLKSLIFLTVGLKVYRDIYCYTPSCGIPKVTYVQIAADKLLMKLGIPRTVCRCPLKPSCEL